MREARVTDVISALGIAMLSYREGFTDGKVPVGEGGLHLKHIHLDNDEEPRQIQLRLSDESCWFINAEAMWISKIEKQNAQRSYRRYEHLLAEHRSLMDVLNAAGVEPDQQDIIHQAWFERMTQEDRDHWTRWMPGGYAVKDDWDALNLES